MRLPGGRLIEAGGADVSPAKRDVHAYWKVLDLACAVMLRNQYPVLSHLMVADSALSATLRSNPPAAKQI